MKKLLAAGVFALFGTGAFAQTSPGAVVLSGNLSFSTYTSDYKTNDTISYESHGNGFYIGPSIGYLLGNNFELGTTLGYHNSITKNKKFNSEGDSFETQEKSRAFTISPYLKKYFMLSDQFALTSQLSAGLRVYKRSSNANANNKVKDTTFQATLAPGITYFPSHKFGISAGLGGLRYGQTLSKTEAGNSPVKTYSCLSFDFEDALYFSLSYYISR